MLKVKWTNRDALDCNNTTCANCQYNDGVVYTSIPPQYKCTITNEFHWNNDKCNVEFAPIKHGHWIQVDNRDCCYKCSECGFLRDAYILDVANYCPQCGARMEGEKKNV